jgi:NitT/TauT family transport system substrate-binding protein
MLTRRNFLGATALFTGLALTAIGADGALAGETKVKVQLAWLPNASNAGEIIAVQNGLFEKRGLEVELLPGGPGANPVQEVVSGSVDISVAYAPQIMYAANNELPIISFAASFQKAPLSFFSLGEANIKSIRDWAGKRIGASQSAIPQVKAILAYNDLKFEDITFVQALVPALMQDQVDVVATWPTNVAQNEPILTHPGGYNIQTIWDNGLQFQSNYFIVSKGTLEDRADMLAKFLEAVDEGWSFAADHPKEAIDVIVEAYPALDAQKELDALKVSLADYIYTDETKADGFGNISAQRWQETLDTYASIGEISPELTASDVFDDRILKMTDRTKR